MSATIETCPFCYGEKNVRASVCNFCGRDTRVPPNLIAERDELRTRREALRLIVAAKERRLGG